MTEFKFNLISAKDLYSKDLPKLEYMVDKLILKRGLTYIVGPPACFKTCLMILIALAGACRKKLMEQFEIKVPFKTLFIDEENGIINTKFNLVRLSKGLGIDIEKDIKKEDIVFANISGFLIIQEHIEVLIRYIEKFKPGLVVIDNIARCLVGSERDEMFVSLILRLLKPIIEKYQTSFVIIHHTRKGNPTSLEDISGSRDFGGQCDNAFLLKKYKRVGNSKIFMISQIKPKYGLEIEPFNFSVCGDDTNLKVTYEGTIKENVAKISDHIKDEIIKWWIMTETNVHKTRDIIEAMEDLGYRDSSIREALSVLCQEHKLINDPYGCYTWISDKVKW